MLYPFLQLYKLNMQLCKLIFIILFTDFLRFNFRSFWKMCINSFFYWMNISSFTVALFLFL